MTSAIRTSAATAPRSRRRTSIAWREQGLQFTNFHVTPMCSPTRAALLTGRETRTRAGVGRSPTPIRASLATRPSWPTTSRRCRRCSRLRATPPRCRQVAPDQGRRHDRAGSTRFVAVQRGFDRYYGFLDAFTNLSPSPPADGGQPHGRVDRYPDGYYLTDDLTDRAVIDDPAVEGVEPAKPFLLYFAHGRPRAAACQGGRHRAAPRRLRHGLGRGSRRRRHDSRSSSASSRPAPAGAPQQRARRRRGAVGRLDGGRERLFARYMEVYAAMVDNVDQNVGRLVGPSRSSASPTTRSSSSPPTTAARARARRSARRRTSSTAQIVTTRDSRAARRGPRRWTSSAGRQHAALPAWLGDGLQHPVSALQDQHPRRRTHGPDGDFVACPLPRHGGADTVPICTRHRPLSDLAGPDGRKRSAGPSWQSGPGVVRDELRRDRLSRRSRTRAYFPILRALGASRLLRRGWEIVSRHAPMTKFTDDEFELYDLSVDPTETTDLAKAEPDRVHRLARAWERAAWDNQVLPLDEGSGIRKFQRSDYELRYETPSSLNAPRVRRRLPDTGRSSSSISVRSTSRSIWTSRTGRSLGRWLRTDSRAAATASTSTRTRCTTSTTDRRHDGCERRRDPGRSPAHRDFGDSQIGHRTRHRHPG